MDVQHSEQWIGKCEKEHARFVQMDVCLDDDTYRGYTANRVNEYHKTNDHRSDAFVSLGPVNGQ